MKRRDLLRHLTQQGCELLREGGRHSWWQNADSNRRSAIPRHREINDHLARKIHRAANPDRSPKPLVHAASREKRRQFREGWRRFVESFLAASKRLREGARGVKFPPGSFPPRRPFVPLTAGPSG